MRSITATIRNESKAGLLPIDGDIVSILPMPNSGSKLLAINRGFEYCVARVDADLQLDARFGPDGTGFFNDTFSQEAFGFPAAASLELADGKLLLIGAFFDLVESLDSLALARYDPQGNPDAEFGDNGKIIVALPHHTGRRRHLSMQRAPAVQICRAPMIQADGSIVFFFLEVSDEHRDGRAFLIRLTAAGQLDTSFNGTGFAHVTYDGVEINPKGAWLQDDNKLLVYGGTQPDSTGHSTAIIGRFSADGSVDESFGAHGFVAMGTEGVVSRFTALLMDDQQCVVAIGNDDDRLLFTRLSADGTPDITLNRGQAQQLDLPIAVDRISGLKLQSGALVAIGTGYVPGNDDPQGLLLRLCENGTLDRTFAAGAGYRVAGRRSEYLDMEIESDGQIIVGGYAYDAGYVALLQRVPANG